MGIFKMNTTDKQLVGYKLPKALIQRLEKERTRQIGNTGRDVNKSEFVEQLLNKALKS